MIDPGRLVLGRELRASLRTWLIWTAAVGAMVALTCALQPSMATGILAAKLDAMPETLRRAFGMESFDFERPAAYLATNFTTVSLATSLFAALLGAGVIAKEEALRTAELLYTLPASRERILAGKLAALVVYTVAFPCALAAIALGVLGAVVERPLEPYVIGALFVGATAVALCFAGLGALAAALVVDKRSAAGAALGVVLGSYFLGVVSAISTPAARLRWLSPHKLVEPAAVLLTGLPVLRVVALVVVGALASGAAMAVYRRRDILT